MTDWSATVNGTAYDQDDFSGDRYGANFGPLIANLVAGYQAELAALITTNFTATSTTSLTVGTGSKVFTVQSGKGFVAGQPVIASSGTNWMFGTVTSYSGTTLTLSITTTNGSGTLATWTIALSGPGLTGTALTVDSVTTTAATQQYKFPGGAYFSLEAGIFRLDTATGIRVNNIRDNGPLTFTSDTGSNEALWLDFANMRVKAGCPNTVLADGSLSAKQVTWSVDESGHNLLFKVKYADGTTVKTCSIALS